jgi:pyruvate,water dikinase
MAAIEAMWELRDVIEGCERSGVYWLNKPADDIAKAFEGGLMAFSLDKFAVFLKRFGHHSKHELDLMVPRFSEDPAYVISQVQDVLLQPSENDPRERNKTQKLKASLAQENLLRSAPLWKRRKVHADLLQVREFLWWREELRDLSTKFYGHVRRITLEVEKRLLAKGVLLNKDDIFFLERDDLIKVMQGNVLPETCQSLVEKNRAYYRSFSRYQIPDEIGARYGAFGSDSGIETDGDSAGIAGSPGVATGIARVIANIDDADRLQPGDILVTRCTDPGWTTKFSSLAGVVTETGGILSHAAVICREYGIPAVLAVKNATTLIKDGQTISIDGSNGQVILNEGNEESSGQVLTSASTVKDVKEAVA